MTDQPVTTFPKSYNGPHIADYGAYRDLLNRSEVKGLARLALAGASASVLALALVASAGPARAQAAKTGVSVSSKSIEAVVVTANRRKQQLSKVAVAVTAISGNVLAEEAINREQDLSEFVPGLTVNDGQNGNQLNFSLRGQTLDPFSGASPAVLAYLDDVPFPGANTATSFFDFSSIQVLKGPQGTLFGRNATGGAVLYTTKQPTNGYGGYLTVRVGERDTRQVLGAVNVPLIPGMLEARIAGDYSASNGYITNIRDGSTLGNVDNKAGRITLVATPTDRFKNVTVVQYADYGGTESNGELFSYYKQGETNNGFALTSTLDSLYGGYPTSPPSLGNGPAGPGTWPGAVAGYLAWQKLNPYKIWLTYALPHHAQEVFGSNTTTFEVTPEFTLKNIVGFVSSFARTPGILTGSPFGAIDLYNFSPPGGETFRSDQWSEEFQAQGKALNKRLKYIVGAFALTHSERDYIPVIVAPELTPPAANIAYNYTNRDRSLAAYAQGTYDLSQILSGLSATVGGRYTWEWVSLIPNPGTPTSFGNIYNFSKQQTTESAPSWTLGLQYQINDSSMVYLVHRGSWRAGNFNGTTMPTNNLNYFKNEYTQDYELGYKFEGDVFNRPARFDIDTYEQITTDAQHAVYALVGGSPAGFTVNVPKETVKGVEIDGDMLATSWLRFGFAGAYTYAAYTDGIVNIFGQRVPFDSYPDTPRYSGSLYAQVTLPVPERWGGMTIRADTFAQSSTYFASNSGSIDPNVRLPGYSVFNLRYDWAGIFGSNTSLGLYVKNVFNRFYYQSGYVEGASGGFNSAIPAEPRTFVAEVTYNF